jgi:hypothetical protein
MSIKERVTQALNGLSETELKQVAEFLAFLRFRARLKARPPLDETQAFLDDQVRSPAGTSVTPSPPHPTG